MRKSHFVCAVFVGENCPMWGIDPVIRRGYKEIGHMKRSNGFTMVELVVILFIIAVLIAITVPLGLYWIGQHRFSAMVRSFPNAVLMARMRGIENRSVFTITGSQQFNSSPFGTAGITCCPGMQFTTNVSHSLNPAIPNPTSPTVGDTVMLSGLDQHLSMNGVEFQVITTPSLTTFTVQHAWANIGDNPTADTTGVVRNVTAPGRLTIYPAVAVTTAPTTNNQENFSSASYTIKEEGGSIVFRYDTAKFQATVNGQVLDPTSSTTSSAQISFDNRGFPNYVQLSSSPTGLRCTGSCVANACDTPCIVSPTPIQSPTFTGFTMLISELVTGSLAAGRQVIYIINANGKVDTNDSYYGTAPH